MTCGLKYENFAMPTGQLVDSSPLISDLISQIKNFSGLIDL